MTDIFHSFLYILTWARRFFFFSYNSQTEEVLCQLFKLFISCILCYLSHQTTQSKISIKSFEKDISNSSYYTENLADSRNSRSSALMQSLREKFSHQYNSFI